MTPQIGAITEQGDLGLGFDPLNSKDQNTYNESVNVKNENDSNEQKKTTK